MVAFHRRVVFLLITTTLTIGCLVSLYLKSPTVNIQCYHHKAPSLPSILDSKPVKGKSIFFVETSCNSEENNKIVITSRQACAVESAAKLNPNFEIYLLYVSPGIIKHESSESDRFLQALLTYKNVKIRHLDIGEYVKDTPVELLWSGGTLQKSDYVRSHTSDVLRFVTLWRFGGIYLDLDVVVIKSLENLPLNYAGAQSGSVVAAGVVSFEPLGIGHVLATYCLKDLRDNFDGARWARNGPGVITSLAQNVCAIDHVKNMVGNSCAGKFRVYPRKAFYPVPWSKWSRYFNANFVDEVEDLTKKSYVLHMWNFLSSKEKIPVGAQVPYALFAEKFCPKVYRECVEFF